MFCEVWGKHLQMQRSIFFKTSIKKSCTEAKACGLGQRGAVQGTDEPRVYGQFPGPLLNSGTCFHVCGRQNISGSTLFIFVGIKSAFWIGIKCPECFCSIYGTSRVASMSYGHKIRLTMLLTKYLFKHKNGRVFFFLLNLLQ